MSKANNFNNPFTDMFNQFMDRESIMNMQKQFLNFDQNAVNENLQRNMNAMMKAGQVSAENAQAILRRAAEIAQKNMSEAVEASRDFMSSANPEAAMERQNNFVREATNKAINNQKEIFEMASKSMLEVYDIFSQNFSENMDNARAPKKAK